MNEISSMRRLAFAFAALAILAPAAWAQINIPSDPGDAPPVVELPAADAPADAAQDAIPTKNLLDVFRDGGVLMYPIALCSFVLLVFVFERAIMLRRGRVIPRPFVKRFLQQLGDGELDREKALELCEKNRSPVSQVFAGGLKKWGRPSVEVEQAILDAGERTTNNLRRYLRMLNGISTVSPLLGLLGTVFGMIQSFNTIASSDAMGRAELLAGGISQALLTTAAGLTVAIPALLAYLFFVGRVDSLIMEIDALGQEVVDIISAEAQSERSKTSKKTRGAA
jgi:biopolymer transport protein ExbB